MGEVASSLRQSQIQREQLISYQHRIARATNPEQNELRVFWVGDSMEKMQQGNAPWRQCLQWAIFSSMNLLIILLVLLLLFGGGGFYFGGPIIGGSGLGLILLIALIVYMTGGWRTKN